MKKASRLFKILTLISLSFVVWILLAPFAARWLIVEKPLARADAIFVLGGAATYLERTERAAELYKQGVAPKIFLTDDGMRGGWSEREQRNPYFVERARRELINRGVLENAIETLPEKVFGTDDEAELFARTARAQNLKSVLLVTSAYHTGRARRTFEKIAADDRLKIEIGVAAASFEQTPEPFVWWLSPSGWKAVAGEYVKSFYYWLYY